MSKMVQIRNMPDELHRQLKARAALAGMSLSDYLLNELRESADKPTLRELRDILGTRESIELRPRPAEIIREERDRR